MKRRVLISSEEAVPAKTQHKKPCSDCPWARASLNGWLGENTAAEWIQVAHGEGLVECHTLIGAQCAGAAIYRRNVAKAPRDRRVLSLQADRTLVFSNPQEFLDHHAKPPSKKFEIVQAEQKIEDCPDCYGQETSEGCLTCEGTGTVCGVCGESTDVCKCPKPKKRSKG